MKYRISLKLRIENDSEEKVVQVGESHEFLWDHRDLIKASSGWLIVNQDRLGIAADIVPKLHRGIYELKNSADHYREFELNSGFGTIKNILAFYESLLEDCQQYPYAELHGSVV